MFHQSNDAFVACVGNDEDFWRIHVLSRNTVCARRRSIRDPAVSRSLWLGFHPSFHFAVAAVRITFTAVVGILAAALHDPIPVSGIRSGSDVAITIIALAMLAYGACRHYRSCSGVSMRGS